MSLPVSQYEALLAEVRDLRKKAQRVQQLARPLIGTADLDHRHSHNDDLNDTAAYKMDSLMLDRQVNAQANNYDTPSSGSGSSPGEPYQQQQRDSAHMSVSSEPAPQHRSSHASSLYHGTWPVERTMWTSEPTSLGAAHAIHNGMDAASVMSFASSSGGAPLDRAPDSPDTSRRSSQQLEAKVDMVYSLLAVLGGQEHADMGETLLALSTNPESCLAMRQSGCIPLLVQLVQSEKDVETRKKASQALHNLVFSQPDEKIRKRETRILKLLEQTRAYTEALRTNSTVYQPESSSSASSSSVSSEGKVEDKGDDKHPVQTIAHLMKLSFDEGHRQAICQLGGIHAIATVVEAEHAKHGSTTNETNCILLRRYACMALTNLTFGDSGNKALLCSFREFMRALVVQLQSPSDELRQVTASVLRNLSWRADSTSKDILREVGSVTGLMKAAMLDNKENTLKCILSALWNLSAHCTENKSEICAVENALGFLVDMLTYKTPSKSLAIIENSGGILRNISSQIAVRDDYRELLRTHNCLQILLDQLKSPSLTIVSNACGTLWNLSAKCTTDQELLWKLGAPAMLRSLNHSKHKMIAMGSSAALKNLISARPQQQLVSQMDSTALSLDLPVLPTLGARKQKALLQDLDSNLSELYDNIEKDSPVKLLHKTRTRSKSPEYKALDLSNSFASLNLNEPSTSYERPKSRIPQSFGSTSLPYMPAPNNNKRVPAPCTYIPVRNKFSDCSYEDETEQSDQPIDYSQKYAENKSANANNTKAAVKQEPEDKNFGIYAETDLDQPTDYSLRYAEDDSDSEQSTNEGKPAEFVRDTVKTYCTEDTPYETPFNFSTATSMSDLQVEDNKQVIDNDTKTQKLPKCKEIKSEDEKEHCSTEDISDGETAPPKPADKIPKSEFSSGLMSPEKPVNYCEEGTPGYFSRVSSFGSLNSIPANETLKNDKLDVEVQEEEKNVEAEKDKPVADAAKVVKFEQVVNFAEETPLMFSRSSSLASLDSIEQHSIHDDRSSVVSDLSRLTSGIVSPSELPDSPTQTVPPSPKPRKLPLEFGYNNTTSSSSNQSKAPTQRPIERPQPAPRNLPKPSIFEDNCTKFKEESTPVQFSTATSLSSLTIDEQEDAELPQINNSLNQATSKDAEDVEAEKGDAEKESNISDLAQEDEDDDDDDEDILAACINIGMQNNRHNTSSKTKSPSPSKLPVNYNKYQNQKSFSGIPLPKTMIRLSPEGSQSNVPNTMDTIKTYCTEDTPAILSHAGSNSDLSNLSITTDCKSKKDYLSDDSSNMSGDNDNILAECIQSAMPKSKKASGSKIASCLPRRNIPSSTPTKFSAPEAKNSPGCKDSNRKQGVPYMLAKDEFQTYGEENSPCQFSLRSSLSDLTVDGSVAGLRKAPHGTNELETSNQPSSSGLRKTEPLNISQEHNSSMRESSRRESLSSISVESLGSLEAEQALLEQCITSGMPKTAAQQPITPSKPLDIATTTKPVGIATKQFGRKMNPQSVQQQQPQQVVEGSNELDAKQSKNVNAASVAASTMGPGGGGGCSTTAPPAADVPDENRRTATVGPTPNSCQLQQQQPTKGSPSDENISTPPKKSGSSKSIDKYLESEPSPDHDEDDCSDCVLNDDFSSCLERSCETGKIMDNRMLDPDAMIESLDRFTAELVSQASHLTKDDDRYKISTSDNTWNDDTSPNEVTFPSISSNAPNVITFKSESNRDEVDLGEVEQKSNDFSSVNTSTMTESTLIAMEANRLATVFKQEVEMTQSITSVASLELDKIQPPSMMASMANSMEKVPKSPKPAHRKKSLQGLMVRRALSNSLNHGSSLESLDNHSLNLDQINPPSELKDVFDMEGSMTSVASLPQEQGPDFQINGLLSKDLAAQPEHPIFSIKQNIHFMGHSVSDIDNVNPPSLFNEITDMNNSLADVATEAIGSETEVFEDCFTHVADNTLVDDPTEFTDANSITPIQSDFGSSSNESTPKKTKSLSKSMTSKQKRNLARDRYKTYTIAAEMVTRDEEQLSPSEEYKTVCSEVYQSVMEDITYVSPTYSVDTPKMTPKERRRANKSRFETQVLDQAVTQMLQQPTTEVSPSSDEASPARTKLSIRRSFMQKRLENKDRFRTQTLTEATFSPEITPIEVNGEADLQLLVQREANLILKSLNDDLLECETLSLVSNDDDSEPNSGGSINYRTYHKSWGVRKNNVPVIQSNLVQEPAEKVQVNCTVNDTHLTDQDDDDCDEEAVKIVKPKIVKPSERAQLIEEAAIEEPKGIRGRRKPLFTKTFSKPSPKPVRPKTVNSPLVKNVTSNIKAGANRQRVVTKPPTNGRPVSSGYGQSQSPKTSPARSPAQRGSPKASLTPPSKPLERQGTFTKEDVSPPPVRSKIPTPGSKIPGFTSKIARAVTPTTSKTNRSVTASPEKTKNGSRIVYNRSTSADSPRKIQSSPSTHSLKNADSRQNGAVKKSAIPAQTQRSNSNSSLNSNGSAKKQVTSKIASLWKKIEESKNKAPKPDQRKWIQAEPELQETPRLIRSNTFDNKDKVTMRQRTEIDGDDTKRVSRLGSFIVMDENEDGTIRVPQQMCPAHV